MPLGRKTGGGLCKGRRDGLNLDKYFFFKNVKLDLEGECLVETPGYLACWLLWGARCLGDTFFVGLWLESCSSWKVESVSQS